jgi:hypothetical protein
MQFASMKSGQPQWKYRELVSALGATDNEVREIIRAEGFDPPALKTVTSWRLRNSVPATWAPLLIDVAMRRGILGEVGQLRHGVDNRTAADL